MPIRAKGIYRQKRFDWLFAGATVFFWTWELNILQLHFKWNPIHYKRSCMRQDSRPATFVKLNKQVGQNKKKKDAKGK